VRFFVVAVDRELEEREALSDVDVDRVIGDREAGIEDE
jgi:hypothetical protein